MTISSKLISFHGKTPPVEDSVLKEIKLHKPLQTQLVSSLYALLIAHGIPKDGALDRALSPDLHLILQPSPERTLEHVIQTVNYHNALLLEKDTQWVEGIDLDNEGSLLLWIFDDNSALLYLQGTSEQLALRALAPLFLTEPALMEQRLQIGAFGSGSLAEKISTYFLAPSGQSPFLCLSSCELLAFSKLFQDLYQGSDPNEWQKGISIKNAINGNAFLPQDWQSTLSKALARGKAQLRENVFKKFDELRKERELKLKKPWHDAMVQWILRPSSSPIYDGGLVGFLMSKPNLFGQFPVSYWTRALEQIHAILLPLPEGDSPDLELITKATAQFGTENSQQIAHYMYRYHRMGGAKILAKRILEQNKNIVLADSQVKTGLAALLSKKEDPVSDETKEATRSAGSIEFAVQYGAALALGAAVWGLETAFENPSLQAKAFLKSMRGANEISLESFGWFARLMYEFSDGFLSKQMVEDVLMQEMELNSQRAESAKARGGKITLENEWSGKWGLSLARRKVREYLALPLEDKKLSGQPPSGPSAIAKAPRISGKNSES